MAVRSVGGWREMAASLWRHEPGSWGTSSGEVTADWEDLVHAVVNRRVCELETALQFLVVMICKCSINPITNPNPSTVTLSRDNMKTVPLMATNSQNELNVLFITHLSACLAYSLILKAEAMCSSETSVNFYQTTHWHINTLHGYCHENLIFHVLNVL
jgi:hypothetical protein